MKLDISYKEVLSEIENFIFDVDGVMTDGSVTLMPDGSQIRKMSTRDGYALQLAVKKGLNIYVISGGKDPMVAKRLEGLGIKGVFLGIRDKSEKLEDLVITEGLQVNKTAYMGDDMPDYDVMKLVKLACCPKDACSEIREISDYISPFKGGEGCVRDIIEQTMKVQGLWGENDGTASI